MLREGPPVPAEQAQPEVKKKNVIQRMGRGKRILLSSALVSAAFVGGTGYYAKSHPEETSDFLRATIGNKNRLMVEGWVFKIEDKGKQWRYELFGGKENPYGNTFTQVSNTLPPDLVTPTVEAPLPPNPLDYVPPSVILPEMPKPKLATPEVHLLQSPAEGEGKWIVNDLPYANPDDPLMVKTYVRPDKDRPYASLAVLLLDKTKMKLNLVGGTEQPGRGPGRIPESDLKNLIVAFNGGFQNPDGYFGMFAQGTMYMPLRNGIASVVVMADGSIKMGAWGEGDLAVKTDDMVAIRQNCALLVKGGEVTPEAENKGSNNDIWGYIDKSSSAFITWRSAIGVTKDGNLIVAIGNDLSAKTLAYGMQAAGAETAMQLDINSPHSTLITYAMGADGTLIPKFIRDKMGDRDLGRFYKTQARDFMYITLADKSGASPILAGAR
ncbi:MAG: phosphodiester glycosidase family protein [Candidatus Levyibacteriota bacterium]